MRRLVVTLLIAAGLLAFYNNVSWFMRYLYPLKYEEEIAVYSEKYDLDPYLVAAVIRVESRFLPHVVSHKGAVGLMQIMPATADWAAEAMGLKDFHVDDLKNADTNIRIGTWYLAMLLKEFDGDTTLALAAYNGGMGNVAKWLKSGKLKGSNAEEIPFEETRDFVSRVHKAYKWYKRLYNL